MFQETYQVECDIATGEERENACRPLERFENLVRQSGQYPKPIQQNFSETICLVCDEIKMMG